MKDSVEQLAAALYEITTNLKPELRASVLDQFVKLLGRRRQIKQADRIIQAFIKISKRKQGIVSLDFVTAREIGKTEEEKIGKTFGDKVEISATVDTEILGGIKIKIDDKILDASLKKQLELLAQKLNK